MTKNGRPEIPEELQLAFQEDLKARELFWDLPVSHQKIYINWIVGAKTIENRAARAKKCLSMVMDGIGTWLELS
jgi:uncharacterized protein YdeI (YjbR/CyaY-like superfamily)